MFGDHSSINFYLNLHILGDKGATGPTGDRGPKGDRGYKGDKGETGMVGMTGLPGPFGVRGLPGEIYNLQHLVEHFNCLNLLFDRYKR